MCAIDRGVNEGEPASEQFYEQGNEDQFHDPSPKDRTSPKASKMASSIPSFDACFCPSFINTTQKAYFIKLHMFCLHENTVERDKMWIFER